MKILIIRRSALGDTIHTLPLANALRLKYPDAQIDWVVEDKAALFIENNPLLNKIYIINKKKDSIISFVNLIKNIRKEKYDIAVDTQQLIKSGIILGLSGAKRKITLSDGREFSWIFANEIIKSGRKQFDINYHVVNRNLEIAEYLGCNSNTINFELPEINKEIQEKVFSFINEKTDKTKPIVVLAPETTWVAKHWEENNWKIIIEYLLGKANIIYTGTKNDNGLSQRILNGYEKEVLNLAGKTGLLELAELFKHADLVITPDSGSAHIAWATGKPKIIALFFATSAKRTAPFGEKYFSIQAECECSPCMKKKCKYKNDLKNQCVNKIQSENIVNIIKKVLQFT